MASRIAVLGSGEPGSVSADDVRVGSVLPDNFSTILVAAGLFIMICAQGMFAQSGRANISGIVMDSQGAVVSSAVVTATNAATGVSTTTTTNASGNYNIVQLIPGDYTIKVEREGFGTQVQNHYTLVAEQNAGVNFTLQPGKVSEKITVEAGAELVHTETAELSETINTQSIDDLPLNGRNPASLVLLAAGTVDVLNTNAGVHQSFTTFPTDTGASTNGGRMGSTLYLLDGAFNEDTYHLLAAPFPNPDATQEFTVIGNNFDSRYGFTPGGVVSIVTKSGTNNWHGDVFEFFRNPALNATDYFTKQTNGLKQNQFGGSLGGPILKDKLFIFGNYQGTRSTQNVLGNTTYVPSQAMLNNGDFSDLLNPTIMASYGATPIQLINPSNDSYGPAGVPFTGNIIPTSLYDPASVAFANALPQTTDPLGQLFAAGYAQINNFNESTIRADYNVNDHQRVSFRAFDNFFTQPTYSASLVDANRSWIVDWQNYAATWTWTINPHMVNSFTPSYSRMYDTSSSGEKINGKPACLTQFGVNISIPDCSLGIYTSGSGPGFWIGQNFNGVNRWTGGLSDSLSISKGRNLMVAGVDVMRQYLYENTDWYAVPSVGFGDSGTFTGWGNADFLLGDASSFTQGGGETNGTSQWMIGPYVSDQFKVTPHLTIQAGLRWEPFLGPRSDGGRIGMYEPGHQSTRYPNAPDGVVYPGDAGIPSAGTPSSYSYFEPHLGIAWQPKSLPNTSIRSAFGMYSEPINYSFYDHAADMAPFSPQFSLYRNEFVGPPYNYTINIIPFGNPWSIYQPTGDASPFPPFAFGNPSVSPGSNAQFTLPMLIEAGFTPNFKAATNYTWNLSIEHQFGSNWLARAAYVGSESAHEAVPIDENPGQFFGVGNPQNGLRVNPNFSEILVDGSEGTANYQSGQFTLQRRFANGLQFAANYTWSHTIATASDATPAFVGALPNQPLSFDRSNASTDTPQVLVINFIYKTPSLAGWNGATQALLGGWEVTGIWRVQSGNAIGVGQNGVCDYSGDACFADRVPGVPLDIHSRPPKGGASQAGFAYFNAAAFTNPAPGQTGDSGQNPLFSPGVNDWTLGLDKNFRFGERYRLQFRWEMFNAFNHPEFGAGGFSTGQFNNLIGGTNGNFPAREMQAALKLYF